MRRDANWLGRVKTYLRILLSLFICLSSSFFPPSCVSLLASVSLSLSPLILLSRSSFYEESQPARTQERREIEYFKSRWRFPWQAPPSLDSHWFLNDTTRWLSGVFLNTTLRKNLGVRGHWKKFHYHLFYFHKMNSLSIFLFLFFFRKSRNEFSFLSYGKNLIDI